MQETHILINVYIEYSKGVCQMHGCNCLLLFFWGGELTSGRNGVVCSRRRGGGTQGGLLVPLMGE